MRLKNLRWIVPLVYCFSFAPFLLHASQAPLLTQTKASEQVTSQTPVVATLLSDQKSIQPGHPFWVAVELKMADGWDTYWINPGDAGFPTKVEWTLPEGFQVSPIQWPYPEKFVMQSLVGYGYTHSVLLLAEITPPSHINGPVDLKANVSWLACKEQCVPGNASLTLSLPVSEGPSLKNEAIASQFSDARRHLPKALSKEEGTLVAESKDKEIVLNVKGHFEDVNEALFIPETKEVIDGVAPQTLQKNPQGDFALSLKKAHPEMAAPSHMKGVLVLSENGGALKKAIAIDSPITTSSPSATVSPEQIGIKLALLFAFVGGLILNVMPCVLPVVALKIFSFVKMGQESRRATLKHGGIFALGVMVSFWVLSGVLLALRATGQGIGWGFQLQDPVFVTVLVVVLFLLAISLFGVFELGTSLISLGNSSKPHRGELRGSFLSGVLATLVATPCTGPLLGPAVGFAMTLPPISALCIFSMMGLGMAFPYVVFSAYPKLVRFLPKPGNWMIAFKQLMGFVMMATCLWLIWVLSSQTSVMATFVLLGALLVIGLAGWIYGHFATPIRKKSTRYLGTAVAVLLLGVSSMAAVKSAKFHASQSTQIVKVAEEGGAWGSYSPEKVSEFRREGKPVFVDFTAKWCLICQTNKVVLHSSDVQQAFTEKGIVTMEADWTKRDAVISKELEKLGRSGVPVYVLYPANPDLPPVILPQTLTKSVVINSLNQANLSNSTIVQK